MLPLCTPLCRHCHHLMTDINALAQYFPTVHGSNHLKYCIRLHHMVSSHPTIKKIIKIQCWRYKQETVFIVPCCLVMYKKVGPKQHDFYEIEEINYYWTMTKKEDNFITCFLLCSFLHLNPQITYLVHINMVSFYT